MWKMSHYGMDGIFLFFNNLGIHNSDWIDTEFHLLKNFSIHIFCLYLFSRKKNHQLWGGQKWQSNFQVSYFFFVFIYIIYSYVSGTIAAGILHRIFLITYFKNVCIIIVTFFLYTWMLSEKILWWLIYNVIFHVGLFLWIWILVLEYCIWIKFD